MARVELHGATDQDYVESHGYMAQEGFTNTIRSDAGKVYELPPAECNLIADCTRADALGRRNVGLKDEEVVRRGRVRIPRRHLDGLAR